MAAFHTGNALAANWIIDGSLNQLTGYDDNFRLAKTPVGTFEYFLTPRVNFKRNDTDWDIDGTVSYALRQYSYSLFNNNPQNYNVTGDYKTQHTIWGLNAAYSEVLTNSISENDTGIFTVSSTRTTETLSPRFTYLIDSRNNINLTGIHTQTTYSTTTGGFSNFSTDSGTLGWKNELNKRLTQNLTGSYSRSEFKSTLDHLTETYNLNYGLTYLLNSQWNLSGTFGERLTNQSYIGIANSSTSSSGWTANIGINHTGLQSTESLQFVRSVIPSGLGGLTQQSSVSGAYNYKFSDRWNFSLNGSFLMSQFISNQPNTTNAASTITTIPNRTYFSVQPAINWNMNRDINLSLSYIYRQQEYNFTSESKAVMLNFNYNWSGFNISR